MVRSSDETRAAKGAEATAGSSPRLHQRVFELLAAQIAGGVLAAGARLSETAVAAHFGTSRAPARRALADLERAGLLLRSPAPSHGYVVRAGDGEATPAPGSAPGLRGGDLRLVPRPSWERIYAEVESEIVARISFASWRLNEAELARCHGVSRTVARDVIGRLQQSGVIRKDDRSRWFAPALTPEHVGELYELRWLLEPAALRKAVPRLPEGLAAAMRADLLGEFERAGEAPGSTLDRLEQALHVTLLGHCGSTSLMQALALPQSLLIAHRFLYLWTPQMFTVEPLFPEHLEILERVLEGRAEAAAEVLEHHLMLSRDRAVARIEIVKRAEPPASLPYLVRMPARD